MSEDHIKEAIATITEQVKHIKENVEEMKSLFNKMCDKLADNCTKTAILENRVDLMSKIMWGLGTLTVGLLFKYVYEVGKLLMHPPSILK